MACGGGATTAPGESTQAVAEPEPTPEPVAEPTPEPEPVAEAEPEPEPEPPAEPSEPPLSSPTAEEIQAALQAASTDGHAFTRLVDPAWGIGVFDPAEAGVRQYCDMDNLANHPGLGFIIGHEDRFECNRDMTRCTVKDSSRHGFAFVFRAGPGGATYINTIVHYPRQFPNSESGAARAFVRGGDGVCSLYGALRDPDGDPPARFSVFISTETGLVPEVVAEHKCGDEAAAAYDERLASIRRLRPRECNRNPSRCEYRSGDEDYRVYADDDGAPIAVTITRHGMHDNLARNQQRAADTFLRAARRHSCGG